MPASEFVTMRDGLIVPADVLKRMWMIEERGVQFRLDEGDVLVGPRRLLAQADLDFVREHKALIVSILSMEVAV